MTLHSQNAFIEKLVGQMPRRSHPSSMADSEARSVASIAWMKGDR